MKSFIRATLAVMLVCIPLYIPSSMGANIAATETWHAEFEAVCGQSNNAMAFTPEKLRELIARLDKLVPAVEKLDESSRKIYSKRIGACRNLYAFVLECKEAEAKQAQSPP